MTRDNAEGPRPRTAPPRSPTRAPVAWLLAAAQVLLALISIPPGIALLQDPTGLSLDMPSSVLAILRSNLPFIHDFFPVGVWLVSVYGTLPIVLALGVWASKRWARRASTALGGVVVVWIGVELAMFSSVGFTWFYPLIGGIGLVIFVLSLLPALRNALSG